MCHSFYLIIISIYSIHACNHIRCSFDLNLLKFVSIYMISGDQVAQRSSSVDFTLFPGQRKDFLMAASIVSAERSGALLGGSPKRSDSIKRVDSIKRSDSMKRAESMKRKKARPMIWDHFDDVPHTRCPKI